MQGLKVPHRSIWRELRGRCLAPSVAVVSVLAALAGGAEPPQQPAPIVLEAPSDAMTIDGSDVELWVEPWSEVAPEALAPDRREAVALPLLAGYDDGFFIVSDPASAQPMRLRVNFQNQFRYSGMAPAAATWTDTAGNVRPIADRNGFDVVRGRVIFSGQALDPDLEYYLNFDYGTLGDDRVTILLGWLKYRFHRALEVSLGKGKVPGGREWLITSMFTLAPDRTLATTFFRPSITTGIWAGGELNELTRYQAIVGNGFNTANVGFRDLDTNFVYAGNLWCDPWGDFGGLYSDLDYRPTARIRFGGSLTASRQSGRQIDGGTPEETLVRLSDGTDLTEPGALGPGVSVTDYSIMLASIDAGWKHRGVSLTGEYFLRWLYDIRGSGAIPASNQNLFDHGFHLQLGSFVRPRSVELYTRTSHVFGPFGNGGEWAGGFNWFMRGDQHWKFCCDLARLIRSPAEQIRTGYDAGSSGLLVRVQMQTMF